jgi:hypothetical protein
VRTTSVPGIFKRLSIWQICLAGGAVHVNGEHYTSTNTRLILAAPLLDLWMIGNTFKQDEDRKLKFCNTMQFSRPWWDTIFGIIHIVALRKSFWIDA